MKSSKPDPNAKWTPPVSIKDSEIHCPSTCVALGPLFADGESKLIVAHGGQRGLNMKLKIFHGLEQHSESALADMPTAICHFINIAGTLPSLAVAAGPSLLIYKNLKPYYKFTAPKDKVNETEAAAWKAIGDKEINMDTFLTALRTIEQQISFCKLAPLSQTYLLAPPEERPAIIDIHAVKFTSSATITCVSKLTKSAAEVVELLVIGTENGKIHFCDTQAFSLGETVILPSVPVAICTYGFYSVEYKVFVQTRDSLVYSVKNNGEEPRVIIVSQSIITSMVIMKKLIVYSTAENIIHFHNFRGKKINSAKCLGKIKMLEPFFHAQRQHHGVFAVFEMEIRMYDETYLLDVQKMDEPVAWVKFGCYGREEATLVTCLKNGVLRLQMFRRTANFDTRLDYNQAAPAHALKLAIPKKTKTFMDQVNREKDYSNKIHQTYQKELFNLKFKVAQVYQQMIATSSATVSTTSTLPVDIAVDINGFGPRFRITVHLLYSGKQPMYDMYLSIVSDPEIYDFDTPLIPVCLLAPGQSYSFTSLLFCKDPEKSANCEIRALLVHPNKSSPIVTAIVKMPFSEFPLD